MTIRRLRTALALWLRARLRVPPYAAVPWQVADPGSGHAWLGRTVAVSGAAGLLGRTVVAALAAQGATVHAIDIDAEGLETLGAAHGDRVITHVADLTRQVEVSATAERISARTHQLHALVHCIGKNDYPPADQPISADQWHDILATNLVAPAITTDALVPLLAKIRASGVVLVTSVNGRTPSRWPHYAAAKAGLAKLNGDLALRLAPVGIRVNVVSPGWFTEIGPDRSTPFHWDSPLINAATPVDAVVNAVLFLADPLQSPCTTGAELALDAGEVWRSAH